MNKYAIVHEDFTLELSYRGDKLMRIEVKRGRLEARHISTAPKWLPLRQQDVAPLRERYPMLEYQEVSKPASLYSQYVEAWFAFYEGHTGIKPRFSAKEGQALKKIKAYLESISTDEEALATWQALLHKWRYLDEFYRKSPDVCFINSQINKILNNLQDATSATKGPDAAGLRGSL